MKALNALADRLDQGEHQNAGRRLLEMVAYMPPAIRAAREQGCTELAAKLEKLHHQLTKWRITKMSEDCIRHLTATEANPRFIRNRNWDKPEQCLQTLSDLGFPVTEGVRASAAAGRKSMFKVNRFSLDKVLANSTLKLHERIGLKTAAARHGFLVEDKR